MQFSFFALYYCHDGNVPNEGLRKDSTAFCTIQYCTILCCSTLLSSVLFPPALTLVGQVLLHRPERSGHVLVLSDIQLQQLQARGAESGQTAGPRALSPQTASKHREAPLVQATGQLEAKATVAPCDQHTVAMAILRGMLSAAPHRLDEKQQQQHEDREKAHGLAHQKGAAHNGGLVDCRSGPESWSSRGQEVCGPGGVEDCLPASLDTPATINKAGREDQKALRCMSKLNEVIGSAPHVHVYRRRRRLSWCFLSRR